MDNASSLCRGAEPIGALRRASHERKRDGTTTGRTVRLSLPSEEGVERIAMASSAALAQMTGFPEGRVEAIQTAVSEACLNAVAHGNGSCRDATVTVTSTMEGDSLVISVLDQGPGFQRQVAEPSIERKVQGLEGPGGLGIYMVSSGCPIMDRLRPMVASQRRPPTELSACTSWSSSS